MGAVWQYDLVAVFQLLIGNARYHCSCVRYLMSDSANSWLIIGLLFALGLLIIIIIIVVVIVVVLCRRRGVKKTEQTAASNDNIELREDRQNTAINPAYRADSQYSTTVPNADYIDLYDAGREYRSVHPDTRKKRFYPIPPNPNSPKWKLLQYLLTSLKRHDLTLTLTHLGELELGEMGAHPINNSVPP